MAYPVIREGEFAALSAYVSELSGILVDPGRAYLMESRLGPLLEKYRCADYSALLQLSRNDAGGRLNQEMIDAISTNETSFFRDQKPFDLLKHKLVPDFLSADSHRPIRILSAACSTGQEVYSILIALHEILFDFSKFDIHVLGADISDQAVSTASQGIYSTFEVGRGLLPTQLSRHFIPLGNRFKIRDELRAQASFQRGNLLEPMKKLGRFQIIFCRNVAIYFPKPLRARLFERMADLLAPGGALIIGSTESLLGVTGRFERMVFHEIPYFVAAGSRPSPSGVVRPVC